jgi:hypothetical protein
VESSELRRFDRSAVRTRSQRVAWEVLFMGGWKFLALGISTIPSTRVQQKNGQYTR